MRFARFPFARFRCGLLLPAGWLVLLLACGSTQAAVCRVDTNGSAANSGAQWSSPKDLTSALADSSCSEIWVRQGTYKPTAGGDRAATFSVRPGVAVYGGFAGNETQRSARDPNAHSVTLSGDIGTSGDASDNSYHVVLLTGSTAAGINDAATRLDGFIIRDGHADNGGGSNSQDGGGILCMGEGSGHEFNPTLANLVIRDNQASFGGGLYSRSRASGQCSPRITDVVFKNNKADFHGGAMFTEGCAGDHCDPVLTRVSFEDNEAIDGDGGGMYNYGEGSTKSCSPVLTDVRFFGNVASDNGGGMANDGYGGDSSPRLTNVTFANNRATGTAFYAGKGGAMDNSGADSGRSWPVLRNVTFYNNYAHNAGGAIHNDGSTSGSARADIRNGTFYLNSTDGSGATFYNNGTDSGLAMTLLTDSIAWGGVVNGGGSGPIVHNAVGNGSALANINHSVVEGGCPAGNTCTMVNGTNPILDPLQNNGGYTETMAPHAPGSAINAANSPCLATDQRGMPRPQGGFCDAGAVEVVTDPSQVSAVVTGSGSVSAAVSPAPLTGSISNCSSGGGSCSASYPQMLLVSLGATPASHWHFTGWGGDCAAAGTSTTASVITDLDRNCTADFAINAHAVGGTVSGLAGSGLVLQLNGGNDLSISANGSFSFAASVDYGSPYSVSVLTQPSSPAQTCAVSNASGPMPDADVSNVLVACATDMHVVTGSVATGQGSITPLTQSVADGATATLTVTPTTGWHVDSISGCGGSLSGSTYTTAAVMADCAVTARFAINTHTVGGTVSGLTGSGLVLQLNGGNDLSVGANGSFGFAASVDYGSSYSVTVLSQPGSPAQTCTMSQGSGTMPDADVSNVLVACATDMHVVTGSVATGQGSITPLTQSVADGATATLTVTPATGWHIDSVSGCGGVQSGNTFTTAAITADCAVTASFAINRYTVGGTVSGGHGSILPGSVSVDFGDTATLVLTADTNYELDTVSGCGGNLNGNQWITAPITADCTVTATFRTTIAAYAPVPALDRRLLLLLAVLIALAGLWRRRHT